MKKEKREEYNLKQLNIEIPAPIMKKIKDQAYKQKITIKALILSKIMSSLQTEMNVDKGT